MGAPQVGHADRTTRWLLGGGLNGNGSGIVAPQGGKGTSARIRTWRLHRDASAACWQCTTRHSLRLYNYMYLKEWLVSIALPGFSDDLAVQDAEIVHGEVPILGNVDHREAVAPFV